MTPHVYFHIPDLKKAQQVIELCRTLQFTAKPIRQADAGKTVGVLTEIPGAPTKTEKLPAGYTLPELLIFRDLGDTALDIFLKAYRQAGIPPVSLKAVVTQHNKDWSLYALVEELQQERAAMLLMRQKNVQ